MDIIKDFISGEKKLNLKQLLIVVSVIVGVIVGGVFLNGKVNDRNVNKIIESSADEAMISVVKADEDNNSNNTIFKAVRDWNKDNKDTGVSVSAYKLNDCLIVEAVYEGDDKNKALSKSGDCDNLREVRGVNTSDKVETRLGDSVVRNGDTVVVSADGFAGSDKVVVELVAPNDEKIVSESILKDGSVSAEFLIPESKKYIGVWNYSIKSDENTFNVENNFIVE